MDKNTLKSTTDDRAERTKHQAGEQTDESHRKFNGAAQQVKGKSEKDRDKADVPRPDQPEEDRTHGKSPRAYSVNRDSAY